MLNNLKKPKKVLGDKYMDRSGILLNYGTYELSLFKLKYKHQMFNKLATITPQGTFKAR